MAFIDPPLVSILTITYNSAAFVKQTIESVLGQAYKNIEYIICDDCSTDHTWDIVNSYDDPRIRAVRNKTNLGEYPNRNLALGMATGKYVIFIDGDDFMYPYAVSILLHYAVKFPGCAMFFSRSWNERILCPWKIAPADIYRFEYMDSGIMGRSFANVFFDTAILQAAMLPLTIRSGDAYIQLKIAKNHAALMLPGDLTWWRKRPGNATEKFFENYRGMAEVTSYRLGFLNDADCPLSATEIDLAKKNIYGNFLRMLPRLLVKGKIKDLLFLIRTIKVPGKYYRSFFIKGKYGYFDNIKGDAPLHTPEKTSTSNN